MDAIKKPASRKILITIGILVALVIIIGAIILIVVLVMKGLKFPPTNNSTGNYTSYRFSNCSYGTLYNGKSCEDCGTTDYSPNIRIVGGVEAIDYSWPAQVMIIRSFKFDFSITGRTIMVDFLCGGTLITPITVLSAAHCFADKSFTYTYSGRDYDISIVPNKYYPTYESMVTVYTGVSQKSPLNYEQKLSVAKITIHSSYNSDSQLNDIALVILNSEVKRSSKVKLACLPKTQSTTYPEPNQFCYASGWGALAQNGASPTDLYNVKLNVYDSSSCAKISASFQTSWNTQICAGQYSGGKDTCQGDSGGGLYVFDVATGRYIVSGITSYGIGCAKPYYPGVYTRISYFLSWIYQNERW